MAENKILPWAQTGTANVLSDADYASDVASGGLYGDGVKTGQASSKQANKTWRQATAPGSGLAQFLVDNLGVDVTDADTPSTFSTRIANAVLKLAQVSPFNQSWATATGGYRKYAIVSDSSGNFWVSTADQNVTVPGASGAKWQSLFDGYATQEWANGRFQPAGDYATNTALQSETTNRTNADTNLQNQINTKASLSGATFTGSVNVGYGAGWGGSPGLRWSNGALWFGNPDNSASAVFEGLLQVTDVVGDANNNKSGINIGGYNFAGTRFDWYLAWNGNITTPKGLVAFQSDLPLPVGMHCQIFTVDIPNPVPADGWIVNIPTGWSTHSYVTGCDTGANVYVVSAKVENSTQARVWAKFPTNGALAAGGTATISSFGYF